VLCSGVAHGADQTPDEMQTLRSQIIEQTKRLEMLKRQLAETDAKLLQIQKSLGRETLGKTRGAGPSPAQGADSQAIEVAQASPSAPVGQQPERERPQQIAQIFEQPGVLTPRGKLSLEPGFQYSYSTTNRVALVGYTIIPALLIGLIDVREVHRNTFTPSLTARWGVTNRFEIEAKIPYVHRSDSSIERPYVQGSANPELFNSTGTGIGDVEFTGRYQLNDGGADGAYYIGTLRLKTRTGKDPFEVLTDTHAGLTSELQRELPTGSGFYTIQPGLTMLYPADPAVFFGSISYQHNIKRSNITMNTTDGPQSVGEIAPGDVIGFNFGMGLALNDRSSFSIGYDHASVGRTKQNGAYIANSVRTELGTLLLGYSYRINKTTSLNVSVGMGVTRDTPDVQLSVRLPMSF
jgi:opacity protein-like surface antigen